MKDYRKREETTAVLRLIDGMIIEESMAQDWQVYQEWLQAGNTPDEPEVIDSKTNVLMFVQFMKLFTVAEETAFVNSTQTKVKLFLMRVVSMQYINLESSEIIDGLSYLVQYGIITEHRKQEILSNKPQQG